MSIILMHQKDLNLTSEGATIKKGSKMAVIGTTGDVFVQEGYGLLHVGLSKESGQGVNDFTRGGNNFYSGCTIQDPTAIANEIIKANPNKGLVITCAYLYSSNNPDDYYYGNKKHLGVDIKAPLGTIINAPWDVKVIDESTAQPSFGNAITYDKITTSSSTPPATKHKYHRTHGEDQGYYEIEDKYMNGLKVIGTTSDKYPCKYSTDNKTWMGTKVIGTTTMDIKL